MLSVCVFVAELFRSMAACDWTRKLSPSFWQQEQECACRLLKHDSILYEQGKFLRVLALMVRESRAVALVFVVKSRKDLR